ncbi:Mpo1 family 2-hydroxy fatty acid dioxygenase [Rheinheimera salexigens]|uniref:DUF962 domain-containing protein n=1 Tax=Rheinheimera salexigens TaxID=1628148 RepID=A0A1E7Q6B0_9GAMM|nr:Mpo1-like protein [Rheinheimera salexigens]OEY69686.1 hypothetical protein BI198_09035 [Rheinheimera salexigens]
MKTAQQWFDEYGQSHNNGVNKAIHWLAVPIIYLTVLGLLWQIPMPFTLFAEQQITWSLVVAIPILMFYFNLSFSIGLGMTLFTALGVMLIRWYQLTFTTDVWLISILLFIVMWILQFIGHKVEGKKPSFFQDLQFLLIGPAWLLGFIYRRFNIKY